MVNNLLCILLSHILSFVFSYQLSPLHLMFADIWLHHVVLHNFIGFFSLKYTFAFLRIHVLSVVLICLNYCSVFSSVSVNKFCIPAAQPVSLILLLLLIILPLLVKYFTSIACLVDSKYVRLIFLFFQVVAGALVRLTMELGYSTCRKGHNEDIATCQLRDNSVWWLRWWWLWWWWCIVVCDMVL